MLKLPGPLEKHMGKSSGKKGKGRGGKMTTKVFLPSVIIFCSFIFARLLCRRARTKERGQKKKKKRKEKRKRLCELAVLKGRRE